MTNVASRLGRTGATCAAGALAVAAACASAAAVACPAPPPPVRDLDIPRFYGDAAGSRIDPAQKARHEAAVVPLTAFLRHVTTEADRSLRRNAVQQQRDAARCALSWIAAWAKGDAWLGKVASQQGEYQRKWDLAGVALAYLKVKAHASADERGMIEPWLDRFAIAARAFFDDPRHKRNNHWYWLGLALGATGLAIDSERHWAEARRIMADAARDIRADGALPLELARQGRAVHYHAFAVMPLVILAELGAARGEDWYGLGGGALHRLVGLTVAGFADPRIFERLSGSPQQPVANSMGTGWLPLYAGRYPGRLAGELPDMRSAHRWTGGDVMPLAAVLARPKGAATP